MADKKKLDYQLDMDDVKQIHRQLRVGECKEWKLPDNHKVHACRVAEDEVTAEHLFGEGENEVLMASFRHKKGGGIERIG